MLRNFLLSLPLILAGIVFLILPLHVQMTGLVLLLLAAAILLCGLLRRTDSKFRETAAQLLTAAACVCLIFLMAVMSLILQNGQTDWETARSSDYAVVLGAAVRPDGNPSRMLRLRLKSAMEFMEKNPDAMVILSGGQGDDEPVTEADCMYDTLLEMGADPARLLLEEESSTTRENLINSKALIDARGGTEKPITLITNEFHQSRAGYLADKLEISTCPVSAHTDQWFLRVNYTLREVFAYVKAFLQGN